MVKTVIQIDEKTKEALDLIHEGNHIIFREIGRVCEKYGLTYFLDSGNLIGAVRNGSDIPWDDDADIAMTRKDFEVFRKVAPKELKEGFAYVEPDELDGGFFSFIPRVVLLDSTLRKDSPEEQFYGKGIYNHMRADIFIVDDVSDNMLKHKFNHMLLVLVYGMCMGRRYHLDYSDYKGISKLVVAVLAAVGRVIPLKTLIKWYDGIGRLEYGQNKKKKLCYYSNCLFEDLGKVYKKKWFSKAVYKDVDGEPFPCPCGYDGILRTLYSGDYMVPPKDEDISYPHCEMEYVSLNYKEKHGEEVYGKK